MVLWFRPQRLWRFADFFPHRSLALVARRSLLIMLWCLCSPKGGAGVSTLATAIAGQLASSRPTTVLDVGGDVARIVGIDVVERDGFTDWLDSPTALGIDVLESLQVEVLPGLSIIPRGRKPVPSTPPVERLVEVAELRPEGSPDGVVIADAGVVDDRAISVASVLSATADRTTLVTRACYLSLTRTRELAVAFDDVVEVVEGGRALRTIDVEAIVGRPVVARVPCDPAIARAVDSGMTLTRPPRSLRRAATDLISARIDRELVG